VLPGSQRVMGKHMQCPLEARGSGQLHIADVRVFAQSADSGLSHTLSKKQQKMTQLQALKAAEMQRLPHPPYMHAGGAIA